MTEHDLENLKSLPVPPPRQTARRAAFDAALQAFDTIPHDSETAAQGNVAPVGLREASHKRSFPMFRTPFHWSHPKQALAASFVALMIAAPLALNHMRNQRADLGQVSAPLQPAIGESTNVPAKVAASPAPMSIAQVEKRKDDATKHFAVEARAERPSAVAQLGLEEDARRSRALDAAPPPPPPTKPSEGPAHVEGFAASTADKSVRTFSSEDGAVLGQLSPAAPPVLEDPESRDRFEAKDVNPIKDVASEPVSTFSLDVDTASYSFVRRSLTAGHLPPKDAVRIEEMINYFPYAYPAPESADVPFKPTISVMPSPWNAHNKLVHIAIKGYDLKSAERPRTNLVLLLDVSGSMQPADRLPLIKTSFRLLVDQLRPDDTVAIVTYASGSGIALEPTKIADKTKILTALDKLGAGGSTAGAAGIADAYRLAETSFDKNAVNRVILATDGDFNVGITDQNELKGFIERKRQSGIFLSILGVGQGNHNDALMQTLAQNGNGTAAYVDTLNEARKVLVDEASSTLFTIAKDVKVQVEWNPRAVSEYRLIGYETRALRREDFNNDAVDAGDVGSGHTVTAIYEVTPSGAPRSIDELRYAAAKRADARASGAEAKKSDDLDVSELGFFKLRYKRPGEETSQLISLPINVAAETDLSRQSADVRFAAAVAAFGQLLKGEPYTRNYNYDDVIALAQQAKGDDTFGYRAEFISLVRLAKSEHP